MPRPFTAIMVSSILVLCWLLQPSPGLADKARPGLAQGRSLISRGQPKEALAVLSRVIGQYPDEAAGWFWRGQAYGLLGEWSRAGTDLSRALELEPLNHQILFLKARAALNQGQPRAAMEDLDQLLSLDPEFQPAWALRAIARGLAGDDQGRMADLNKALELDPRDIQSLMLRGQASQTAGDGPGALNDFAAVIKIRPDLAEAYFLRSTVFIDQHQPALALTDAEMAAQLAPDDKTISAWLARLEGREPGVDEDGGRDAAREDQGRTLDALTAELEKRPEEAELYLERGRIYTSHSMFGLARADLDMARMLDGDPKEVKAAFGELAKAEAAPPKVEEPEKNVSLGLKDDPEMIIEP